MTEHTRDSGTTSPGPVWILLGALTIAFHIGLVFVGLVPNLVARPLHMALALPWTLVLVARNRFERVTGLVMSVVGIVILVGLAWQEEALGNQYGFLDGNFQIGCAIVLLLITLEMARRSIGWPLPLVAAAALAYGLLGEHIPGEFGHPGIPLSSYLGTLTIAEGGLWGSLAAVSVNIVAVFVIFGAVLNAGEAGQGFMNIAAAAAGRLRGGAAKVSIVSSALFGSISGSASANVASTGAITLPAMTRLGYPRALAGATEAVASSGGQIMPPLMGAGAFVMVELLGVPYTAIMAAALPPALLYFFATWVGINAFSRRFVLRGLPADQQPPWRIVAITSAFFLLPFSLLMWGMFGPGYTPQYAACIATFGAAILLAFDADMRPDLRRLGRRCADLAVNAGRQVSMIAAIILCASLVIGVLSMTGLGIKVTSLILSGAGQQVWVALALTAIACLILGMEVPTTAAYVICVSVAGPALIELGLSPLLAHLFVFWYALISTITPPVCGAVFIAAGMVSENWLKVALFAMALGVGLYLIPLGMVASPALIELAAHPWLALAAMAKVGIALAMVSYGTIAPAPTWRRALLVVVGLVILFAPVAALSPPPSN